MADNEKEDEKGLVVTLSPETRKQLMEAARSITAQQAQIAGTIGPALASYQASMKSFQDAMRLADIGGYMRQFQRDQDAIREALRAVPPYLEQLRLVQQQIAESIPPWHDAFKSVRLWSESLNTRLSMVPAAVILAEGPGLTIEGFARLSRISDAAHHDEPFAPDVGDLLKEEFGDVADAVEQADSPETIDAAAIDAGFNASLISFEPSAYPLVLRCAGFDYNLPALPGPVPIEGDGTEVVFDADAWALLRYLENALRHAAEKLLRELHGDLWLKRGVPPAVLARWEERQQEARDQKTLVYEVIYYADFTDLRMLIERRDNWRNVFEPIFRVREDILESLRRLPVIRNSDAHSRPLSRAQILMLNAEATRIIGALRKSGLLP